jgi:hypothetical protein
VSYLNRLSLPAALALLALTACGTNQESVGLGIDPGAVGLSCTDNVSCADGLECNAAFPGGYCTAVCDSGNDCPGGTLCRAFGDAGVCVNTCIGDTDCRNGYRCASVGDGAGNEYNVCEPIGGTIDPPDGSGNGSGEPPVTRPNYGKTCTTTSECGAADGLAARCLPEAQRFPGGYCSAGCEAGTDQCGAGSPCLDTSVGGLCMDSCETQDDCRDGYGCCETGAGPACLPLDLFPACQPPDNNGGTDPTPVPADGQPAAGDVGAECESSDDCEQGDEPGCYEIPGAGNYCSSSCETRANCGDGNVCLTATGQPFCVRLCDDQVGCADGLVCCPVQQDAAVCIPDSFCRQF